MKVFKLPTEDLHGYSIKFSSNDAPDSFACVAATNYGLSGSSHLIIFEILGSGYVPVQKCSWNDAIFDLTWKLSSNDIIVTGSGDGKIQIWPFRNQIQPCSVIYAHDKEVSSVNWCRIGEDSIILSSSWDGTVKLWDVCTGKELGVFLGHKNIVYEAAWSPHLCNVFASVGADRHIHLWDARRPDIMSQAILSHDSDVLTVDWSVLEQHVIATGSVDKTLKVWDLRKADLPICSIFGHAAAIRRVKFSPFQRNILASSSYDFNTKLWDWRTSTLLYMNEDHTEFVYGLDFSSCIPHKMIDCAWDGFIHIYEEIDVL